MNNEKQEMHNVNKMRGVFLLIGLNISLLLVISAFEWRSKYDTEVMKRQPIYDLTDELIPITEIEEPKPPKPKLISPVVIEVPKEEDIEMPDIIIDLEDITDEQLDALIEDIDPEPIETVWSGVVETKPEPMEGFAAFYEFIGKNLKYPRQARELRIEGKVFVKFVIDEHGNITELEVLKGIGMGCDEEALRVMKLLPPWKPGKQRGNPVRVKMVLPLTFRLK